MNIKQLALGAALAFACTAASAASVITTTVKIIGFNDFHGTLQSPGSFSGKPSGGVDVLAGYVASLKSQNPNSLVISAGDLTGASPLISAFFHDEGSIETMNRLGLEFNAVGNHEFDQGRIELLRKQNGGCHPSNTNTCEGTVVGTPMPFEGAKFKYLAANVVDNTSGKTLFPPYGIKTFNTPQGTVRVGIIGMTLKDTPTIVTPAGVAGLTFTDEANTVNALVPRLRARGVEAIIVLIHQGGFQAATPPNFINDCSGNLDPSQSPILDIVSRLDDAVDLVVSGHTHTGYKCMLPNKVGRKIPVTQASAFGRVLTDINMPIDVTTGDVDHASFTLGNINNIIVDRTNAAITPNGTIAGIVAGYNSLVSPLANAVIGSITTDLPNTGDEMPAGDLIADAQLAATAPAAFGAAAIAFMNRGGVRNPGFIFNQQSGTESPGDVTFGEAFTVQPFGNSLVTMTLSGLQIKNLLEQQFVGCLGQTTQRIMQVSSGFKYSWSASAVPCSKISNITLSGAPVNPGDSYRVTVNNFMSTGGDGFTVLLGGANLLGGAQDIDALVDYLKNFKSPNPPYNPSDPALNKPRITKLP